MTTHFCSGKTSTHTNVPFKLCKNSVSSGFDGTVKGLSQHFTPGQVTLQLTWEMNSSSAVWKCCPPDDNGDVPACHSQIL